MKNKKLLTVSVGTTAYNEEQNIENMLRSVISQKEKTIKIVEIIVVSDGSRDRTAELVKSIKERRIKVVDEGKRLGQPARIGQMLKMFKGDVFVLTDADMVMKNDMVIEKIVSYFHSDKELALVCGEALPIKARKFIESLRNNYIYARLSLEKEYRFGDTAYGAHAFLAYSKKFGKSLVIPKNIINPDAFSFFTCKAKGFKTHFAKDAVILYRSPSSIKDFISQSERHLAGGIQLHDYFGKEFIDRGFYVPRKIKIKLLLYQMRRNPLGYFFLKLLNLYCAILSRSSSKNFDVRWKTIDSSKNNITI